VEVDLKANLNSSKVMEHLFKFVINKISLPKGALRFIGGGGGGGGAPKG